MKKIFLILLVAFSFASANAQYRQNVFQKRYGWVNVRAITIDHTKVPNTDQSNFPVLISGTYSYLATTANGGGIRNSNGYDIAFFTDANCITPLKYDVETWSASTGAVNIWVKVPTVSHTSDVTIYIAYGNPFISTDQSDKNNVWDANYKMVQHLPDGSTLSANDATTNANNGTLVGGIGAATGQIDGAAFFNGEDQYITVGSSMNPTAITLSAWIKATSFTNAYSFVLGRNASADYATLMIKSSGKLALYFFTSADVSYDGTGTNTLSTGTWYYVVATYNSTDGLRGYVNGIQDGTTAASGGALNTATANFRIGSDPALSGREFNGIIDEARVSNVVRSADWIATEYNNQSSPSTFYTVGYQF